MELNEGVCNQDYFLFFSTRRRCPLAEELINKRQPLLFVFIINVIIHFPDH